MATRFYFHNATNSTTGLPTAEQSSLTATLSVSVQTLNRAMNTTIGTGMVSVGTTTSTTSSRNLYYGRWVSPPIFQTSVAANTWTYNFSASEAGTASNFPVSGTAGQPVRVNCYVWRPSTSTKIGTILDGNTASTLEEEAANVNAVKHTTFTGAAVASTLANDVIIFEVWFIITSGTTTAQAKNFFYDGTTVNTTDRAVITNHASFLETPETINLTGPQHFDRTAGESLTVDAQPVKRMRAIRPIPANTLTILGNATRFMDVGRAVSAALTISATPVKLFRRFISIPQSFTIVANALGEKLFARSLGENFIIIGDVNRSAKLARTFPVTLTLAVTPVVTRRVLRPVTAQLLTINATVVKAKRFVRTASNAITIVDSNVIRDLTARRTITEPLTIVASITKVARIKKTISNSLTVTANVARTKRVLMTVNNSFTIVGNLVGKKIIRGSVSENLSVNDSVVRRLRTVRPLTVPITLAAAATGHLLVLIQIATSSSLTISANVSRIRRVPRIIAQSITITTAIISKLCSGYE